ncbi:MAG TPA: hypothetical protein VJ508_08615, partial [Saprospiraceae bacterium]|nr:hypothetical protein [Saprospiraceae bacterium]
MKSRYISSFFILFLLMSQSLVVKATNPDFTKWIRNISEGEGAPPIGMGDYAPEMAVSGKVIHLLWITNNNWTTKDLYYRR